MSDLELFHFQGSHFNEKARWALDWKGLEHTRTSLIPGPHAGQMKKISGQTQVPVLRDAGAVIAGSADILDHLERRCPSPALHPASAEELASAREIQRRFDAEVGPAVRLAKFFEVMELQYVLGTFAAGQPLGTRLLARLTFPIVRRKMTELMGINEANAERALVVVSDAFDFVASAPDDSGYLVGGRFSIADLAAASLLMPAVQVFEWGGPADPDTAACRRWYGRWAENPGAEWVREMYRRHRLPTEAAGLA